MRQRWPWIVAGALALVLSAGAYSYILLRRHVADAFQSTLLPAALGIRAGDVVPENGRVIERISGDDSTGDLTVPIPLYPRASVLGVNLSALYEPNTDGHLLTATILMQVDEPEQEIINFYLEAWAAHGARESPRIGSSAVYRDVDAGIRERSVLTTAADAVFAWVEVARGPALDAMDGVTYTRWLKDEAGLPVRPGGELATTIWLCVPLHGDIRATSPRAP